MPRERVTSDSVSGDAATEIVTMARRTKGVLIVVGRRSGRTDTVRRALLGSVTKAVLDHAPCPALVVPEGRHSASA